MYPSQMASGFSNSTCHKQNVTPRWYSVQHALLRGLAVCTKALDSQGTGPGQCHPPCDSLAAANTPTTQFRGMWPQTPVNVSLLCPEISVPRNPPQRQGTTIPSGEFSCFSPAFSGTTLSATRILVSNFTESFTMAFITAKQLLAVLK